MFKFLDKPLAFHSEGEGCSGPVKLIRLHFIMSYLKTLFLDVNISY
jgi:hypothetical protein